MKTKINFRTVSHMVLICPQMKTSVPGVVTAVAISDLSQERAGVRSQGMKEHGKAEENETLQRRISLKSFDPMALLGMIYQCYESTHNN